MIRPNEYVHSAKYYFLVAVILQAFTIFYFPKKETP